MSQELTIAVWVLRRLPSELVERVLEKISRIGFAWIGENTLHIQGWLLLHQGISDDIIACYIAVRLGIVQVVKLTTYLIQPIFFQEDVVNREVNLISEKQFKIFQEVARGAMLELETSDKFFLRCYKILDHAEFHCVLANHYHL